MRCNSSANVELDSALVGREKGSQDMTLFGFSLNLCDERKEERRPAAGGFWFRDDAGQESAAKWCSIAAQGACVCMSRYLQPGRELTIHGGDVEVHGRIVWCRPMADKTNFVAGIRILGTNETAGQMSPAFQSA